MDGWGTDGPQRSENSTARIPEAVLGPLLAWSLRFVDEFSADILTALQRRRDYEIRLAPEVKVDNVIAALGLHQFLRTHVEQGRPLPGLSGRPNMRFIAAQVGANPHSLRANTKWCAAIAAAVAQVGVSDCTWLLEDIRGRLDGRPWIEGIASICPGRSLDTLAWLLQVSCYVVIAFLSGMRDSETKHLRRGCLTVQRDNDGVAYRWKVRSLAFKGTGDPAGVAADWIIGEPAARAVNVLERLQPDQQGLLFAPLEYSSHKPAANTTATTNRQLDALLDWITTYCAEYNRSDTIPLVNGARWRLTTAQFRRTLAWFIARRPGGSIAGAIQYRHLSIHMFEGYAGTSAAGFRAEVESEQALARGEQLLSMVDEHQHVDLAGPATEEAERRLTQFDGQARFAGAVITDERRLLRLMQRHDPQVYPGTYATCVFTPDKALCQHGHNDGAQPDWGRCQPLHCSNVALTPDNVVALASELDQLHRKLDQRPTLPPVLQQRLRTRCDDITRFLHHNASDMT